MIQDDEVSRLFYILLNIVCVLSGNRSFAPPASPPLRRVAVYKRANVEGLFKFVIERLPCFNQAVVISALQKCFGSIGQRYTNLLVIDKVNERDLRKFNAQDRPTHFLEKFANDRNKREHLFALRLYAVMLGVNSRLV